MQIRVAVASFHEARHVSCNRLFSRKPHNCVNTLYVHVYYEIYTTFSGNEFSCFPQPFDINNNRPVYLQSMMDVVQISRYNMHYTSSVRHFSPSSATHNELKLGTIWHAIACSLLDYVYTYANQWLKRLHAALLGTWINHVTLSPKNGEDYMWRYVGG